MMSKPSKQVERIFSEITRHASGYNLNWCEKTNCWAIFLYAYDKGNHQVASITVDRERVAA